MPTDQTFVIVGASLAGAKAAETLRDEGFDGRVVLLGAEAERPYERPPLSKEYLRGETSDKPYVHDDGYYEGNDIELRTSTEVESIDPDASEVVLAGGERIGYDRLLLTTGSEPRRLSVPGSDLDGILYLRTVADSDAIAERIEAGGKLVTIGAGWIGAEIAASARTKGCEVTVLEMAALPLERVLGPELGAIYRDIHTDHGVELLAETALESFEGSGSVESVRTADGRTIDADFVVVGIGVAPRTKLAEDAGLDVENGVLTTERLETSAQGVYAAGDIANATHPLLGRADPRRALGERPQPGPGGRPQHARQGRPVRQDSVLLLGPVRRRHGVRRLRDGLGRGRIPRRRRRPRVRRLLAPRRPRPRWHERERLGCHRRHPGADPVQGDDRPQAPHRHRRPARRARREREPERRLTLSPRRDEGGHAREHRRCPPA